MAHLKWKIISNVTKEVLAKVEAENRYVALDEFARQQGFTSLMQAMDSNTDWADLIVEQDADEIMRSTNTCDLCHFWHRMPPFTPYKEAPVERGVCARFWEPQYQVPEDEIAKPPASSGSHGCGRQEERVITGPKFGCIKFEAASGVRR